MLTHAEKFAATWNRSQSDGRGATDAVDSALAEAVERSADLGIDAVGPSTGIALSMFARMLDARTVVEIGTGAGVSGLWLLRGMRPDGVLTSIDIEPEHQRSAKRAFLGAGVAASRARMINGHALEVLPRLADDSYDLVFVDAAPIDHPRYVAEGIRLLRPGGALVVHGAQRGGRVTDPAQRDPETVAAREATRLVAENPELLPLLFPLGDGLLCAVRR
ncbi:O-methyltransferase [Rhodococcus sp. D2-41]|nr:O-methyltransferase [Rhodococcus sp. D2-41]